ncbi:MAG: O-acetyl-ADP-ribose deacetylase [Myxococcota bacterium]
MEQFSLSDHCVLIVEEGDLTQAAVDAIVNAANEPMLGGGGVDGAIHRAAGPDLLEACRKVAEVAPGIRCPTGEARITAGFELRARHVIHTVGPVYRSAETSAPLLGAAFRSSLELANEHRLRSIAFPAISCGVYGYPPKEAAPLSIRTCRDHAGSLEEVRFVLFGEPTHRLWSAAARDLLRDAPPSHKE